MYLYMQVTQDKYELPLIVGTIQEVAEYAGTTPNCIRSTIAHAKNKTSGIRKSKYKRVEIKEA